MVVKTLCLFVLLVGLAGCSETKKHADTTNPARITDLAVSEVGDSTVTLVWTATGDDNAEGSGTAYDLRFLDTPLTVMDWEAATAVAGLPVPAPPGTREHFVARGLLLGQTLYFSLITKDDAGNWSLLSNVVSAHPGHPEARITPDSLAFGTLFLGAGFDLTVRVTNGGGGTLRGRPGIDDCPAFSIIDGANEFALLAGQSHQFTVHFEPAGDQDYACTVETGLGGIPATGRGIPEAPLPLIAIETGSFTMGSPADEPGRSPDEESVPVLLTIPFLEASREVTQAEWSSVMGWLEGSSGADRPAVRLTWFDAVEFCNRLSLRRGLARSYSIGGVEKEGNHIVRANVVWLPDSSGFRLPTEAEWEYACRAGTTTAFSSGPIQEQNCLPVDPSLSTAGWYCGNSAGESAPVRQKAPNPWGLYDVHGNVFEWCGDWYAPYETGQGPRTDPTGPGTGTGRIIRGGSFDVNAMDCRSAYRLYHPPSNAYDDVGLRVVRNGTIKDDH